MAHPHRRMLPGYPWGTQLSVLSLFSHPDSRVHLLPSHSLMFSSPRFQMLEDKRAVQRPYSPAGRALSPILGLPGAGAVPQLGSISPAATLPALCTGGGRSLLSLSPWRAVGGLGDPLLPPAFAPQINENKRAAAAPPSRSAARRLPAAFPWCCYQEQAVGASLCHPAWLQAAHPNRCSAPSPSSGRDGRIPTGLGGECTASAERLEGLAPLSKVVISRTCQGPCTASAAPHKPPGSPARAAGIGVLHL